MSEKNTKKMYTFTVVEGEHQGFQKIYKKGDTFQSEYPLDTMFVGKFLRGADVITVDVRKPVNGRNLFAFADADEVTEQFPLAKEHDLRVFKDAMGGHVITSAADTSSEPMNLASTIMGSKPAVNKWLVEYAKRQEQD
ncbi:MAG: hypothetical protein LBU34_08845 [Planctomycetaceae bacterium]|jgi:uncharacterized protein (UPF0264 family)|nr:hypothetical protein [Planctomycetaceae bacterium]